MSGSKRTLTVRVMTIVSLSGLVAGAGNLDAAANGSRIALEGDRFGLWDCRQ
jgi:hypothetical protein